MKAKLTAIMQSFSRAAVQPVMFLAIMGTVIALTVIMQMGFMPAPIAFVGGLLRTMMDTMLNNLALIFCVGLAAAFAKEKRTDAAIISVIVFLMFLAANQAWLSATGMLAEEGVQGLYGTGQNYVLGFQVVDMNVFLGIILGCVTGFVPNKLCKTRIPEMFSAYGGSRFVFLVMIPVTLVLAIVLSYVWPVINGVISSLSTFMTNAGAAGVFCYAFGNRFLVPTGLHHLFWMPFCYTPIGGTVEIAGEAISGAANIFYAEMANTANLVAVDASVRFTTFGFAKMFGCLGIGLAMIRTAKPEHRKVVQGMLVPSMLVAMMAGITEPFDFSFLFISPFLWLVHGLITAVSETLLYVLGVRTFAMNGFIDTIASNIVIDPALTKIVWFFVIGVIMTAVWYIVFTFFIKKMDIKTPGRDDSLEMDLAETNKSVKSTGAYEIADAETIIEGLGGADNITSINNCFTRLRVDVKDVAKVNEAIIKKAPQKGVIINGNNVQIIIGLGVEDVKSVVKGCWRN